MRVTIELSDADVSALGQSRQQIAEHLHDNIRCACRGHGGPGATAAEYDDSDGTIRRQEADPPSIISGWALKRTDQPHSTTTREPLFDSKDAAARFTLAAEALADGRSATTYLTALVATIGHEVTVPFEAIGAAALQRVHVLESVDPEVGLVFRIVEDRSAHD